MNDQIPLPLVCQQISVCRFERVFRFQVINIVSLLYLQGISFRRACLIYNLLIVSFLVAWLGRSFNLYFRIFLVSGS
jgi:hypothetical protein